MKFTSLLASVFAFVALLSTTVESVKAKPGVIPITLFTTKELDSNHLIRTVLVYSGIPFTETRFKKDSESQRKLFKEISESGFLPPSIPMIVDSAKDVKYISTDEAVLSYIILSYNKELLSKNLLLHTISIQLSSLVKSYIKKTTKILDSSKTLACSKLLANEDIHQTLKVLNDSFISTEFKYLIGNKVSYSDLIAYNLILFIENVSSGCVISNYKGLRDLAFNISSISQIYRFENSSYFLSLLVPGTHTFAKRINFAHGSPVFKSLAS
ncbi:glutathione S-transferase alpha I-like isoform X1 [Cryptosporidium sp. chipmunk genotype I]|uniref:glutathione S-transferase alpha I-like isoform X1 n=1 Tax=Cryptosporidium sp. chipmunk genotype I TaxID=1280935 RepID=UPI00351A53E9|nr:glutathione S-transferase alpha I-like isoform X1 [Cryptosporidium sp. chipmunk genotype I]